MTKDIDKEIEKLLEIKEIVDEIKILKVIIENVQVLSQARYDFLASKNAIKLDVYYYIAPLETRPYIEDYQG